MNKTNTPTIDTQRTALLSPVGIPSFTLRYTPRAIYAMEDAGLILAKHTAQRTRPLATTPRQADSVEGLAERGVVN